MSECNYFLQFGVGGDLARIHFDFDDGDFTAVFCGFKNVRKVFCIINTGAW
ncbi:MAG: hypothetical protein VXW91_00460 [Pseudomonadota bacterium]|nr:hypothetical protein [Pseudomonadota bacterium]